jgi:hypothetical protein
LKRVAERRLALDPLGLGVDVAKPTLRSLAQYGTRPQRNKSRLRSPAFTFEQDDMDNWQECRIVRTTGSKSVGAVFQLGGNLGVGRCGGIEKTSLISLTSEERRTRPHMQET